MGDEKISIVPIVPPVWKAAIDRIGCYIVLAACIVAAAICSLSGKWK